MNRGTVAIAVVQHQVMIIQIVQGTYSHHRRDQWLDVYTYTPFGDHLFLASSVPQARIASSDLLTVFPFRTTTTDMIELPAQAYQEFLQLKAKHQKKQENLWHAWKAKLR
ncbi:hypothetical protein BDR07DRAFT_1327406 [Suillus spraguei]|nr:hypothetical protein BDR07DRAFT_1475474 [Suillus spraguei]KAG2366916.1 hypothetical protein BDR07DRAFT_1327406 [Suillus spraguei]